MNAMDGPEAALTTGLVPLILICGAVLWVVLLHVWHTPPPRRRREPDLSDRRAGASYARSIAAHPAGRGDIACRYCGHTADDRAGTDVCLDVVCLRQAIADRDVLDDMGLGA